MSTPPDYRPGRRRPGRRPNRRGLFLNALVIASLLVSLLLLASILLLRDDGPRSQPGALEGEPIITVAVFDVGQALSVGVVTADGRSLLYDFGLSRANVEDVIVPFFAERGIDRIDYAVLSHPHQDHVGGLPRLLEMMPVGLFLDPVIETTNLTYLRSLEMILDLDIPAQAARRGDVFELGEHVSVEILWPTDDLLRNRDGTDAINDNSTVLRLTAGDTVFLLTGDVEGEAESILIEQEGRGMRADVLQVAHHGSNSSTGQAFLDVAAPAVAIISAGYENRYGHPHREVLQRLRGAGSTIYRTDVDGTVTIRSDGQTYEISTENARESWRTPRSYVRLTASSAMGMTWRLPSSFSTTGSN
jgi:competence protein ComEC